MTGSEGLKEEERKKYVLLETDSSLRRVFLDESKFYVGSATRIIYSDANTFYLCQTVC